jgi:hypothetical protein
LRSHSQATKEKIRQSALKAGVGKWNKARATTLRDKITESIRSKWEKKKLLGDEGNKGVL